MDLELFGPYSKLGTCLADMAWYTAQGWVISDECFTSQGSNWFTAFSPS